ncbi:aminopeptidase P N-terminal domain-containing protein [Luteibaculum oceani]|uniref:Xaa-Pro aminopeptidase n=1 Tax=Luteibaculum oceani TaxID=1294296 RepID=A0A5C6V2B7_9FLAO|nr:aminopeptidase P N-terminal domain-containing protein [Luteibaculum oceani]TXC78990.1 M24 family metallopeptidase [Luteibaculum oceani]
MRYENIGKDLFIKNRKKFMAKMEPKSIAVFFSNDILPTNADGTLPFRQNNDLFYLCGVDQEETILVLFPDAPDPALREVLFVRETNEHIAVWEGEKLDKDSATEQTGVETVVWTKDFDAKIKQLAFSASSIYLNSNEHLRAATEVETREERLNKELIKKFPLHNVLRAAPIMHDLRAKKEDREVELMRKACNITEKGFRRLLSFVKPGVMEYEIEAELMHEFLRNRSRGFAYTPIIASGANACVLHYIENKGACNDGDLILLDVGAEYANYASDMSRTIPVNGRFTDRQKAVYNAVLKVQRDAMNILRPGITLPEYHKEVGKMMEAQLLDLKLLDKTDIKNQNPEWPAYKKYFMHGTSHYIGLDVHDVGSWSDPINVGNVFTVEPGIYIPEENLGVRLENDILISKDGYDDLMGNIPIEAEEIEELMNA